jgi:alpha-D-ribose 1-methylphosphonate 5-triphosphate synthase subunit PhnG
MTTDTKPQRQINLSVLAKAPLAQMLKYWREINVDTTFTFLKKPEVGMAMVRAQAGGGSENFNMGEMTMTRCVIRLDSDEVGYGFVAGRSKKKSELIAIIDACWQKESLKNMIEEKIIEPLYRLQITSAKKVVENTKTSKVNFFTMVRGE